MTRDGTGLTVTLIGGPTAVLELAGLRLLTDPTFDPPGSYEPRPGVTLTKTAGPSLDPRDVVPVDMVLLSHDHHMDNLDGAGREFLARVTRVLTTVSGAGRIGDPATPMERWATVELERPDGGVLRVMGVPAQHGPDGSEHLVGEVTGFVLSGQDLPTVYVSGDNASLEVVRDVAERAGPIDVAILFAGGAQMPYLGDAYLTLSADLAVGAARILRAGKVVPLHLDGWSHFSEGIADLREAFARAGIGDRLVLPEPGRPVAVVSGAG